MKYILYLFLLFPVLLFSQNELKGVIQEANEKENPMPLPGTNVYWLNTEIGTVTDVDGRFVLPYKKKYSKLVISYVGYKTDTLQINSAKPITHWLQSTSSLDEVVLSARKKTSSRSYLKAQNEITVSSTELLKAACCNLSESFETNPSIDVNFTDAISGTRQIKMLGLSSPYILIATENIPSVRGASQIYGLSFIPGTWVKSIQITKGAGSVVNGFESIAGQINAELAKPVTNDRVFVNVFGAANGRLELNTHINTKITEKWSSGLYLHGNSRSEKFDKNEDSFLDAPLAKQINMMNRWQFINNEKGLVSFINLKFLSDKKQTGQLAFNPKEDKLTTNYWGSEIETKRYEVSTKLGYVNPEIPYQSLGVQTAFSFHDQESYFGLNTYNIEQESLYVNAIFNSIIGDSRHKFKTGLSYTYDSFNELVNTTEFKRNEIDLGAFFEYSFDNLEDLTLTAGLRVDTHNLLGVFVTPRLHARYTPWEKSAIRFSVGRGKRSANIFAENQNIFSTSRQWSVLDSDGEVYGLDPEIAWNSGVSFLQGFNLFGRKTDVTLDFYRTDFKNQVIVDYENPQAINFYNLKGKSIANSFQAELNYNVFEHVDLRFAYKYYNVTLDYNSGRLEKPLTPKNRVFANVSYKSPVNDKGGHWKMDMTYNWLGRQRFSLTETNAVQFQLPEYTPEVSTLNAQLTNIVSSRFEVYLGAENITNTKQESPIISPDSPFGSNFDTTFVYGPIFGSNYYAGLRFKI